MGKKKAKNIHAINPIMLKGGVHEKSKKAKRAEKKNETRNMVNDWSGGKSSDYSLAA